MDPKWEKLKNNRVETQEVPRSKKTVVVHTNLRLGKHVFTTGVGQADKYRKTTEAIAEYAGRTIMNEMYVLILKGEEATFAEPAELAPDEAKGSKLEKYRILLKMALDKQDKYDTAKGLTFRLIIGQCNVILRGKVENDTKFENLQKGNDVAGLMKLLKSVAYSTVTTQHEFWSMQAALSKLINITQYDNENVPTFGKRFTAQLEATEEVFGRIVPPKYQAKTKVEQDAARDQLLACIFLSSADRHRFKHIIDDLNNDFLRGKDSFPTDIASMSLLLENYRGGKHKDKKLDAYHDGMTFTQKQGKSSKTRKKKKKIIEPEVAIAQVTSSGNEGSEDEAADLDAVAWSGR